MQFKTVKQLFVTPTVGNIQPNTVYYVRAGDGFDLYCTDSTGNAVYQINKREDALRYPSGLLVDGSREAFAAALFIPVNNNIKFFPFILNFDLQANSIRLNVTTVGGGSTALYLLDSTTLSFPENLIFKIPSVNFPVDTTGVKSTATVERKISNGVFATDNISNFTLKANKLYWWGIYTKGTTYRLVGISASGCLALGTLGTTGNSVYTGYNINNVATEPFDIVSVSSLGPATPVNYIAPSVQLVAI